MNPSAHVRPPGRLPLAVLVGLALSLGACGDADPDAASASPPPSSSSPAEATTTPTPDPADTPSATPSAGPTTPSPSASDEADSATAPAESAAAPSAPSTDGALEAVARYVAAQDASGADPHGYVPRDHMSGFTTKRAMRELTEYQAENAASGMSTEGAVEILDAAVIDTGTSDSGYPSAEVQACLDAGDVALTVDGERMPAANEDPAGMGSIPYTAYFTLLHSEGVWKVDRFWTPESSPC